MAVPGISYSFPSRPEETSLGVTIMGVDPGQSTGWAKFIDGEIDSFGTVQYEAPFQEWLAEQHPNVWVVEDYIIQPKRFDHNMDKGVTLQVIGAIKFQAQRTGSVLALQQAALKPGAYAHMGATYVKGKKGMHYMDAIAHAHEYMLKNRMISYTG